MLAGKLNSDQPNKVLIITIECHLLEFPFFGVVSVCAHTCLERGWGSLLPFKNPPLHPQKPFLFSPTLTTKPNEIFNWSNS